MEVQIGGDQQDQDYDEQPQDQDYDEQPQQDEYTLFNLSNTQQTGTDPFKVNMNVNGCDLIMEVDTGASISLISENTYKTVWNVEKKPPIKPTNVQLQTYTGERIAICGAIEVTVSHLNQSKQFTLIVVSGDGPNLLGRDWLNHLKLDWQTIYNVKVNQALKDMLHKHRMLFSNELGTLQGTKVTLQVDASVQPKFCKARPVPLALQKKVAAELDQLEASGVIEKVTFSEWAAPIVPVLKQDGSIRICGYYKLTVNKAAKPDVYL